MQNAVPVSFAGNLTGDPELKFLPSGQAVARFTVAFNPRTFDQAKGEWGNGDPSFYQVSAFGPMAERFTESLTKGDRVMVIGRLEQRQWTDKDSGEKRSGWQVVADELGASVAFGEVKVTRGTKRSADDVPPPPEWANASTTRPEPAAAQR
jgi:single-strand DNA-binding protein